MIRKLAFLAGLAFAGVLLLSLWNTASTYFESPPEPTAADEFHLEPRKLDLPSDGLFGHYDRQQLQRGFQVYKEVCSACHSLNLVAFRNLRDIGYSEAEVKAIANQWQTDVASVNPETGEPAGRKATPADHFPPPFPNETAARANNNNALPPDLSLIVKSREGHSAYVYSLLTGYRDPKTFRSEEGKPLTPEAQPPQGLHFNPYFANLNIAMPPPLVSNGQVQFADGTPSTVDQMAKDVAAFLTWTSEPKLEARHATGITVLLFLLCATILGYLSYKNIWATAKRTVRQTGPLDPLNQEKAATARAEAGVDNAGEPGLNQG